MQFYKKILGISIATIIIFFGLVNISASSDKPPIFESILEKLLNEKWNEDGNWEGDIMEDATSFAPSILYALKNQEMETKANKTVEYEVELVDKVISQLKVNPGDTKKIKELVYPAVMGHVALIDGFKYYNGNNEKVKSKLANYSQAGTLFASLILIFADPAEIDKNMPEGFPFNRIQAHVFTADACFQLGEITHNIFWGYLGIYLTDKMISEFWTQNEKYGSYFSLKPIEEKPPKDWDQGYSLIALAGAYKFSGGTDYLVRGKAVINTTIAHLFDQERGGFYASAQDHSKYLSGNCAILRGLTKFSEIVSEPEAEVLKVVGSKVLNFFESDLYSNGLLYHHWNSKEGRADFYCTGCNFFALSCMQNFKPPMLYKVYLPMIASNGQIQLPFISYSEWKTKLIEEETAEEQAKIVLKNPTNLFTKEGLNNLLNVLR